MIEGQKMLYKQVVLRKGLPFEVAIPNAEVLRAMEVLNGVQPCPLR